MNGPAFIALSAGAMAAGGLINRLPRKNQFPVFALTVLIILYLEFS